MTKKVKAVAAGPDQLLLHAARMGALFAGSERSRGQFDPSNERMFAEHLPPTQETWEAHLRGQMGLGVVPIRDDDACIWAAIDIDNHETDEDLPINVVSEKIALHKLPLIACRSKSGGIHCYLFLEKPQPCSRIRLFMDGWSKILGYPGSEIFPKQGRLVTGKDGKRALGNWINMPYFGGDPGTMRYAIVGSKRLTLIEFLDLAEKSRVTDHQLRALSMAEHPDAPPCVQKMFSQGVTAGFRNEALYNITIYLRKANPDGYESKAVEANTSVFEKPLPRAEMQRTVASAGRPDCVYRCNEEPIRSLCDREACVTRKFGITSGDLDRLNTVDALPVFSDLVKYLSEPVRWEFKINGSPIANVGTEELLDWRAMRRIIAERLTRVVPMIKNQEWERILQPLMETARILETPDDASISGVVRSRLREFCAKTDLSSRGEDTAERKALLRGLPVVQIADGERCVIFRGSDFVNYLKRTKSEELKGTNLWFAIKRIGVFNWRCRIGNEENINVWCMPVKQLIKDESQPVEFKSDI